MLDAESPALAVAVCYVCRTLYRLAVSIHYIDTPGGVFGRWSRRFFRVEAGLLLYYADDPGPPHAPGRVMPWRALGPRGRARAQTASKP
jgi:hypothetical protein